MKRSEHLTLEQKGLIGISTMVLFEMSMVATLWSFLVQAEAASRFESKAQDAITGINKFVFWAAKVNHSENKFLGTGNLRSRDEYYKLVPKLKEAGRAVIDDARSFPECKMAADRIDSLFTRFIAVEDELVRLQNTAQYAAASKLRFSGGRIGPDGIQAELTKLREAVEPVLAEQVVNNLRHQEAVIKVLLAGVILNLIVAPIGALAFMKGIANRLALMADNTVRLAENKPLNALEDRDQQDEIGQLDAVFHKMAEEVREAARKESALIDNSPEVICSINEHQRFEKVSPAAAQNWNYSPETLIGKDVADIVPEGERETFKTALSKVKHSQSDVNLEAKVVAANGDVIDALWSMHWSDADACFFSVIHDMSDRKRAEEALRKSEARVRTILNSMIIGLMTVTEDGVIDSANPRIEQMVQYTAEELCGQPQAILFPNAKFADLRQYIEDWKAKAPTDSRAIHIPDIAARRKNGELIPVELWLTELMTVEGKRYLLNMVDVTARKIIEQAKQEFVAMISHDLRTPLNSVRGFLELLEDGTYGDLSANGQDRAGLALRNVERLLTLINDLLEINKLESGQLELNKQTILLGTVMERAMESVLFFAGKQEVKLHCAPCNIEVFVDGDRLERVLMNLLSNAIKFSPPGETVSLIAQDAPENLVVQVVDKGRGIPAAHKDLIFERFKQVKSTDATQKGGTGLGLAICKAVVEQHGGTIGVDSEEGRGSTFWIKLPKAEVCVLSATPGN